MASDGTAAEKERLASERLQSANNRASSVGAALATLRDEMADALTKLDSQGEELSFVRQQLSKLEAQRDQASCKAVIY